MVKVGAASGAAARLDDRFQHTRDRARRQGGQVIRETDERAMGPKEHPIHVEDLAATLYHALGIDPDREYTTPSGRPVRLSNERKVIRELF